MCTVFVAYQIVQGFPLIVAANRDEFYDRPSKNMHFWEDHQDVLAGRDLRAKGTWLGVNRQGRFAVTTNYRETNQEDAEFQSRGRLPALFLTNPTEIETYSQTLEDEKHQYRGYNLIFGSLEEGLFYYSNRRQHLEKLKPGIYGLSNHLLDTAWPKVEKGRASMKAWGEEPQAWTEENIFKMLGDSDQAPDDLLPNTGVGLGWERLLSATFIETFTYGTRNSTLLRFGLNQRIEAEEWSFDKPGAEPEKQQFQFQLAK